MDEQLFRLNGRVAIVTGASRGIGRASAAALLQAGASVVLVAREEARLAEAADELGAIAGADRVLHRAANAGDEQAAAAVVASTLEVFGRLDVLVNNAATSPYFGPLVDIDKAALDKTVQVNVAGPLQWTREAVRGWMGQHGGVVVNMASLSPFVVEPGAGGYAVTKAGLVQVTRQLAAELGPNVRVNAIAPGLVKTDMARVLWEQREAAIAARLPLRRLGTPDDIAPAVRFLASDASRWMTGHTLVVDGGALVAAPDA